jgi:protein-tyrosine phosphatase
MPAPTGLNLNSTSHSPLLPVEKWKEIDQLVENSAIRIFKSPSFHALICMGTLTYLSMTILLRSYLLSPKVLKATILLLSLSLVILLKKKNHKIWFETSLLCARLEAAFIRIMSKLIPIFPKRNWYDEIQFTQAQSRNHKLLLGAIPLATMSHHQELQNLLSDHSFSVLTVLQKFENQENGLVGTPIKPTDWINLSIPHKQIEIFDLNPISISELNEGVDFIHQQLEQRHVYVHCKVGRGRSAMMIMGYIMKYHQQELNLQENDNVVQKAIEFVRKSRPQIYVTAAQKSALQDYAVTLFA